MSEIKIPEALTQNAHAKEVLRVWIVDNKLQINVDPDGWSDPAFFGLALADVAFEIAKSKTKAWSLSAEAGQKLILDNIKTMVGDFDDA